MSAGSEDQADETPFVDVSGEHPTERRSHGVRCYHSSDGGGACEAMGLEFETHDEWQKHRAEHHPTSCGHGMGMQGCNILAAYKRLNGPYSYCYKHIPDDPDVVYAWKRTNTESVVEPPRADPDHPIEAALRGLGE